MKPINVPRVYERPGWIDAAPGYGGLSVPPAYTEADREAQARRMGLTREQERRLCRARLAARLRVTAEMLLDMN